MPDSERSNFEKQYSEKSFWGKLKKFAKTAGKEVVEKALQLYYAAKSPKTPLWAKSTAYGALGYFIMPLDAIPDTIPAAGYSDDLGVLTAAIATIAFYIDQDVKDKAEQKMTEWFE